MSESDSLDAIASFTISGKDSAPLVSSEDSSILALGQVKSPTTDNRILEKAVPILNASKTRTKQTCLQTKANVPAAVNNSLSVEASSVPPDVASHLLPQGAQNVPLQGDQNLLPHDARDRSETVPTAVVPNSSSGDQIAIKAPFYPHGTKSRPDMYVDIDMSSGTSDMGITHPESSKSFSLSSMLMMTPLLSAQNTTSEFPATPNKEESSLILFTDSSSEIELESITLSKSVETRPQPTIKTKPRKKAVKDSSAPAAAMESESSCCRICQEGKSQESLISPCYCSGTMGKVHLSCMETWLSLMHRSSCELCQYEFPVERITQPTYKFFLNPGSSTEFANLMCDITCFLILTPLLILTMFLCTRGVKYYDAHGKTGSMFAVVTLIGSLLVVYVSWAVLAFLYHYRIWRTWRKNTAIIRMSLYKNPKVDVKALRKVGKIAKLFDLKRAQRGSEGTQTDPVGANIPAEPAVPGQQTLNNATSPDSELRHQELDHSVGNSRSHLMSRSGENIRGCLIGFKPLNKTKCQVSVTVRDCPQPASGVATDPATCASCKRKTSSRSHTAASKQTARSRFADVSSNAANSPNEPEGDNSSTISGNDSQFTNILNPCVFATKNLGKGIRKTLVKVHGLHPKMESKNCESTSTKADQDDKVVTAIGSHRPKKDKSGLSNKQLEAKLDSSLGGTVTFQIEPSNPAQLVGFRFLNN